MSRVLNYTARLSNFPWGLVISVQLSDIFYYKVLAEMPDPQDGLEFPKLTQFA